MERINKTISWYQSKIGTYDKQLWEMSAEKKVIKSLQNIPRKTATLKSGLIDVDLVRGSAFSKTKPSHSWPTIAKKALLRLVFCPLYYRWWVQQTSVRFFCLMLMLYTCQIVASLLYFASLDNYVMEQVPFSEMVSPVVLMVILVILHGQMVSTHNSGLKPRHIINDKKKKTKLKRSRHPSNRLSKPMSSNDSPTARKNKQSFSQREQKHFDDADNDGSSSDCSDHDQEAPRRKPAASVKSKSMLNGRARSPSSVRHYNSNQGNLPASPTISVTLDSDLTINVDGESASAGNVEDANNLDVATLATSQTRSVQNDETLNELPTKPVKPNVLELVVRERPATSSTEDTGIDSPEPEHTESIVYKPLNDEDTVEANEYESPDVLNQPLEESTGALLVVSGLDEYQDTTLNASATTSRFVTGDESDYIPSDMAQEEGNRDLFGIKKRCTIGNRKHSARHHSTSDVDDLDDDPDLPDTPTITIQVPDPIITINDLTMTTTPEDATENDEDELETARQHTVEDAADYIPSSEHENESGKIDLVGIKKRQQIGCTGVRRRKHTSSKFDARGDTGGNPRSMDVMRTRMMDHKPSPVPSSCESGTESTHMHTPTSTTKGTMSELESEDRMRSSEMASSDTSSFSSEEESNTELTTADDPFNNPPLNHHVGVIPSASDSVSCLIWERGDAKKVDLSVIDIGWHIIDKVDKIPEISDYVIMGVVFSLMVFLLPVCFKLYHARDVLDVSTPTGIRDGAETVFGNTWRIFLIGGNVLFQRFVLSVILFFLLSVAERTFKQRLLYAKNFCYLTSSRKAKKYDLPHFRLNKVRNIKTWLSLRSYLKKKGPQRSVNTVVSAAFLLAVTLASLVCLQLLKDSERFLQYFYNWELLLWCLCLGTYLLRFMTLGTKINKKYRNLSVLITEQINLYLHMEQKPHKKEELMLANNVLKLAEDLLKELESPFKMAGLSVNPFIYNFTKVVILSAISAVASELLGFKLKLYKIKVRA